MDVLAIDANTLIQDYLLKTTHTIKMFVACKLCGISIFIPEVVLDELKGNYKLTVEKTINDANSRLLRLRELGINNNDIESNIDSVCQSYSDLVDGVFEKYDIQITNYPDISFKDVVQESYKRKMPFKEKGVGFTDYILFQTFINQLSASKANGFFITINTKDFCDEKEDLHKDFKENLPSGCNVGVYKTSKIFFDNVLAPRLERLGGLEDEDSIAKAIKEDRYPGINLTDKLASILITELCDSYYLVEGDVIYPLNEGHVTMVGVESIEEVTVQRLEDQLLSIRISGELQTEIFGFVEHYMLSDETAKDVYIDNYDWNDWVASVYTTRFPNFNLDLLFDDSKHEVLSVSVDLSVEE